MIIRVNLLSVKRKKKPKALPIFVILGVFVAMAVILASGFVYWSLDREISNAKSQKVQNEKKIAELKEKAKEVENYEAEKKKLIERTNLIVELKKSQSIPVRIFIEMNNVVPDGIWLTAFSLKGGNDIEISGSGFTNEDIVTYVENLKKSNFFVDVNLKESKLDTGSKTASVYQFKLNCKVKI
jgi:type IV pilus assembly protein PilN